MAWEFAPEAKQTAEALRKHFDERQEGWRDAIRIDKAHWQLIILALEKAAE